MVMNVSITSLKNDIARAAIKLVKCAAELAKAQGSPEGFEVPVIVDRTNIETGTVEQWEITVRRTAAE